MPDGDEAQAEERDQRHIELGRHRLKDQHGVAWPQARLPQQRRRLPHLALQLGERGRTVLAVVKVDDGRRVRYVVGARAQHGCNVHGVPATGRAKSV